MPILKATSTDADDLARLVNSAYRGESSKKGWTTESHLLGGNRIDTETILQYLSTPKITILKSVQDDGAINGCVYLEATGNKLYLGMLSVNPNLQAGGIGKALLFEAEAFALSQQLYTIAITVISSRTELINWYERRGYKATGQVLPFHHDKKFGIPKQPIQLLAMEKELNKT